MSEDYRLIPLSGKRGRGLHVKVDGDDYPTLSEHRWALHSGGYAYRGLWRNGGPNLAVLMHRQITSAPKGRVVDHINGDKLDNRRANLRVADQSVNMHNTTATRSRSGYRGVIQLAGRYMGTVKVRGRVHSVGTYGTPGEAYAAIVSEKRRLGLAPERGAYDKGQDH